MKLNLKIYKINNKKYKKIQIMADFIVFGQNHKFMTTFARPDPDPDFLALHPGSLQVRLLLWPVLL